MRQRFEDRAQVVVKGVEHEPTATISRHQHERRVWTGSDACALDTSRLHDFARRGGGVGS